jgi:hypothetical protein
LKAIAQRARQPSTWAGIAILLSLFGLPAPVVGAIAAVLDVAPQLIDLIPAAGAAGAAIVLNEQGAGV